MSAFICNNYHISMLASYAKNHRLSCVRDMEAKEVGAILYAENLASVNARYGHNQNEQDTFVFDAKAQHTNPAPVAILKALNCLYYQSCEHDAWLTSKACEILDAITANAIRALPGYEEAQWEIAEPVSTRPGDAPAIMAQETGISYERCLVMCNMD